MMFAIRGLNKLMTLWMILVCVIPPWIQLYLIFNGILTTFLDEEIKMIVARGETRNDSNGSDGLLTFLEEHGLDPALDPTDPVIQNTTGSETDKGHFGKHLFVDFYYNFLKCIVCILRQNDLCHKKLPNTDLVNAISEEPHLLFVRPEPVKTRNPLLCQKSSSSTTSGYETCISR